MNLLASQLYDPVGAVSKSTASLLAMTALDTTNLRLAVVVPSHGKVLFRIACAVDGAVSSPNVLLGVMNGATVLGRVTPNLFAGTKPFAVDGALAQAEFIVSGLTPGAMNIDAAYAVQVAVASTNIVYGGPNDNSGADAWGGFVFEAWDPAPVVDKTGYKLAADGLVLVTAWTVDLTGDITGNLFGDVVGNLVGDHIGNTTGDMTGDITGNLTGNVTGSVGSVVDISNFVYPPPSTPGTRG